MTSAFASDGDKPKHRQHQSPALSASQSVYWGTDRSRNHSRTAVTPEPTRAWVAAPKPNPGAQLAACMPWGSFSELCPSETQHSFLLMYVRGPPVSGVFRGFSLPVFASFPAAWQFVSRNHSSTAQISPQRKVAAPGLGTLTSPQWLALFPNHRPRVLASCCQEQTSEHVCLRG